VCEFVKRMKASLFVAILVPLVCCTSEAEEDIRIITTIERGGIAHQRCNDDCGPRKPDHICASDGKTYKNRCKFDIAKCKAEYRGKKLKPVSMSRCRDQLRAEEKEKFSKLFSRFDEDADGEVTIEELGTAMRTLYHPKTEAELRDLMEKADADENDSVDLAEFLGAMAKRMKKNKKNNRFWCRLLDKNGDDYVDAEEMDVSDERQGGVDDTNISCEDFVHGRGENP